MNAIRKKLRSVYRRNNDVDTSVKDIITDRLTTNGYIKQKLARGKATQNEIKETVGSLCEKFGVTIPEGFQGANADTPVNGIFYVPDLPEEGGAVLFAHRYPEGYKRRLDEALERKAAVIFADPEMFAKSGVDPSPYPIIFVEDGMRKMRGYYKAYRDAYQGVVIGVTGSVGKTTTKEYISAVVRQKYPAFANSYNYNSTHIIASNVLNKMAPAYKAFIQEVGGGSIGAVDNSSGILRPNIAVVTNVKPHHLDKYKTIENVFEDKICLVRNMMPGGTAIVNFDDERLAAYHYECEVISFGIDTDRKVDYRGTNIVQDGGMLRLDVEHEGRTTRVESQITGKHNAYNILAAFAVGRKMHINEAEIAKGIREYSTSGTRQNVAQYGGNKLFMDCYNVSNETIIGSVHILEEMDVPEGGRRIAIVGGENKLGSMRVEKTRELGEALSEAKVDRIVCFGSDKTTEKDLNRFGDPETLYEALIEIGFKNTDLVRGFDALVEYMKTEIGPDDAVLFKCIVYLNMAAAIDKVFGTGYCLGQKESRRGCKSKTIGGYTGIVLKDLNEAYITDASDKLLSAKTVKIPDEFDGAPVFALRKGLFAYSDVEKADLGNSVQQIGIGAFRECRKLSEVILPDSVKYIRTGAFKGCKNLRKITLGKGIIQIDDDAFEPWTEIWTPTEK
ncbi:MAG: leucine-rich repeat protein [Firmicutes bacterium]|nr:leucine-rich repeat protein [Bacillota bacterium]